MLESAGRLTEECLNLVSGAVLAPCLHGKGKTGKTTLGELMSLDCTACCAVCVWWKQS